MNPVWTVKSVKALPDFKLFITFEKGEKKIFDFKPYLKFKINEVCTFRPISSEN